MGAWEEENSEGIVDRKVVFCPKTQRFSMNELIDTCDQCKWFYLYCCGHTSDRNCCHHYRIVFTDGAYKMNGRPEATARIGLALGHVTDFQLAEPITNGMDPGHKRTSQRAELLAAIYGLRNVIANDGHRAGSKAAKKKDNDWVDLPGSPLS